MVDKRLLLIEDDSDVAEMLVTYFTQLGYHTAHADTGESGILLARQHFPHVILLDVMLPDIDGYDTCRRLRQATFTRYIPIIFLTQRDERANKVRGLGLGADDYITKPFDLDELRLRVEGVIRRATRDSLHEGRTGLPTGALVEEEIMRRQYLAQPCEVIHLALGGYSLYCDLYGFMAGNDIFAHAAHTIQQVISVRGTPDDFIGVQGDVFLILTGASDVEAIKAEIIGHFAEDIHTFYNFADLERGVALVTLGEPQPSA
jgi:DNA-binding response OmpR family regulator